MLLNFKSFSDFLVEVNYGSLQSDERILMIYNLLVNDMLSVISARGITSAGLISNLPEIKIHKKYKSNDEYDLKLIWEIRIEQTDKTMEHPIKTAMALSGPELHRIRMVIYKPYHITWGSFVNKLKTIIKFDSEAILVHEIKHVLDYVDDVFGEGSYKSYYKPKDYSDKELAKYYNQDQELQNYVTTVIGEIKAIKKSNPTLGFNDVLGRCRYYLILKKRLTTRNMNKLNSKIAYFWFLQYENIDMNDIGNDRVKF